MLGFYNLKPALKMDAKGKTRGYNTMIFTNRYDKILQHLSCTCMDSASRKYS